MSPWKQNTTQTEAEGKSFGPCVCSSVVAMQRRACFHGNIIGIRAFPLAFPFPTSLLKTMLCRKKVGQKHKTSQKSGIHVLHNEKTSQVPTITKETLINRYRQKHTRKTGGQRSTIGQKIGWLDRWTDHQTGKSIKCCLSPITIGSYQR